MDRKQVPGVSKKPTPTPHRFQSHDKIWLLLRPLTSESLLNLNSWLQPTPELWFYWPLDLIPRFRNWRRIHFLWLPKFDHRLRSPFHTSTLDSVWLRCHNSIDLNFDTSIPESVWNSLTLIPESGRSWSHFWNLFDSDSVCSLSWPLLENYFGFIFCFLKWTESFANKSRKMIHLQTTVVLQMNLIYPEP